ncbi:PREDICTED: odorant receptor 2a-like [Habropoda laboriosa]|nr:PREDICTED: odorant receptor 2a-like [Habropoda laboriosa]
MSGATIFMTNYSYCLKVIVIVLRRKRIKDLINITEGKLFIRNNDKYERIVTYYTWQGIFHHITYQSFGIIAVIFWSCTAVVNLMKRTYQLLLIKAWYPYNVTISPAYEFTILHQVVGVTVNCINNVAIDTFITGFIITACCQLTLLSYNISSIHYEAEKEFVARTDDISADKSTSKTYNQLYEDLKICIEHSRLISDFARKIQDTFGTVIFFQLLVNCITVCLLAYNISQLKYYVLSDLFGMFMHMCCMTYQIFIYCWHGNELYLHSMNICFAAYMNNWWHNTKDFKRALLVVMSKAQRPIILTVGNIMELSLENFVLILRTSYSIFTVLKTSTNA